MSGKNRTDDDEKREEFAKGGRQEKKPILPGYSKNNLGKIVPTVPGYPKWASNPNTSSVPDDPQNLVNRAKNEPSQAPNPRPNTKKNGNTVQHDGDTDVVVSTLGSSIPELGEMPKAKQHYPPCINSSCKSFGRPHPGCLCYAGGGGEGLFARGGAVCSGSHKEKCEHYASGAQVKEQERFLNNPSEAIDHMAVHHGLSHVLTKFGKSRSENPHKPLEDYVDASRIGKKTVHGHVSRVLGNEPLDINHNKEHREVLKGHLSQAHENPSSLFDIGGSLGETLPVHAAMLGAKSATAINYLNGLRPQRQKNGPLSDTLPPDKLSEAKYHRQLDLANNPSLILRHAKDGTIGPQDLITVNTIYPDLMSSMKSKIFESIVESKESGKNIPYRQRIGLSQLLGEPLDYTATPQAMMAISQANGQDLSQPQQTGAPKKASQVELNQINKTNDLYETPVQSSLTDKKQ